MCPIRAFCGKFGKFNSHVWVDATLCPFGIRTFNGFDAGLMFVTGASLTRKLLVAPESKIAHSLMFLSVMSTVVSSFVVAFAC